MNITKTPNPDRIFAVITTILQRRYDVQINYEILKTERRTT